jgi:ADP-ribosylglycohydrolase
MAGALAEAYYQGVPQDIAEQGLKRLDEFLRSIVYTFYAAVIPDLDLPRI